MENDWKKRLGMVYSTNPEYQFESEQQDDHKTLPPNQQKLYVRLDRKNRKVYLSAILKPKLHGMDFVSKF